MSGNFNYNFVKQAMKNKGITQLDLVNILYDMGINTQIDTVKSWFRKDSRTRNTPKLATIRALAEILGVSVDEMINDKIQPKSTSDDAVLASGERDMTSANERLANKTLRRFLELYTQYGNEKMLFPLIEKLEKMQKIAES